MTNKKLYGEVITPPDLVKKIFDLLPQHLYKNKNLKWLDPGAGTGNISSELLDRLCNHLPIENLERKLQQIIKMITMVEINENNISILKEEFKNKAKIIHDDFLALNGYEESFDVICGNPPFNFNGDHKVPTASSEKNKRNDGKTIWIDFTKKAISMLKPDGYLLFILPSIWLKPDKSGMYRFLTQYKIHKMHCFNNTESNKMFNKEAQTPCCFFLLQKRPSDKEILLFDKDINKYIPYYLSRSTLPIPVFGSSVINTIYQFTEKVGFLKVHKTNMPPKDAELRLLKTKKHHYRNIHTCLLGNLKPHLSFRYTDKPCCFHDKPKLVLAHGMYGFPYLDKKGRYGISNRDKYVICDYTIDEMKIIRDFLSTKFALYLFESTRYRMKFLERYVFEFIPEVWKLPNFPTDITDKSIADYFGLTDLQREKIEKLHKKNYERVDEK